MNIIGQPSALFFLTRSLTTNHLATSFLFSGPDGVGKRTTALALAETLLCSKPNVSVNENELGGCGSCDPCLKVRKRSHADLFFLDSSAQAAMLKEKAETQRSVKIESVREVDKFLQLKPLEGKHRVAIIEDADTMTPEAANALLKTLEEPPANGRLILLVKDSRALPSTILSRCAVLRFRPLSEAAVAQWLHKEQGTPAEEALEAAAQSGGSLSKAIVALSEEPMEGAFANLNPDDFFSMLSESAFRKEGRERASVLVHHLLEKSRRKLESGSVEEEPVIRTLLRAENQLKRNVTPRVVLESVFISLRSKNKK